MCNDKIGFHYLMQKEERKEEREGERKEGRKEGKETNLVFSFNGYALNHPKLIPMKSEEINTVCNLVSSCYPAIY